MDYVDLKYKPGDEELICEYHVEPKGISLRKACEHIAGESSIGTWVDVKTMSPGIARRLKPHVFEIKKSGEVKIAYPPGIFEPGNAAQILSSIAGNIFGMGSLRKLRLQDVVLPRNIIKSFKGPEFGISGVRKILKVRERPLVGTIVKPKVGLTARAHAKVAYEAWVGGCDVVKDDENLTSQAFNRFDKRLRATLRMREKAEAETGEVKVYMPNVTAETDEMLKRARAVKRQDGRYAMVDIITSGWSALQSLREEGLGLVLHAHRAGHAAFTRDPKHGISMLVIAKLARMIGVDQIHVGAILGKMSAGVAEVEHIGEEIESSLIHEDRGAHVLEQDWYGMKPVFAVCSGGLHPGLVPGLVKMMGKNIICQFGGGIHAHPRGTLEGAKAARQSVDAVMDGVSLDKYAEKHKELRASLKRFRAV